MSSAASSATIQHLQPTFAQFGIPDILVTDNRTCFTSSEFAEFFRCNGIKHIKSAPYYSATNGFTERFVQVFKTGMKKCRKVREAGTYAISISNHFIHDHGSRAEPNTSERNA